MKERIEAIALIFARSVGHAQKQQPVLRHLVLLKFTHFA